MIGLDGIQSIVRHGCGGAEKKYHRPKHRGLGPGGLERIAVKGPELDLAVLHIIPRQCRPQPALILLVLLPAGEQRLLILLERRNLLLGPGDLVVVGLIDKGKLLRPMIVHAIIPETGARIILGRLAIKLIPPHRPAPLAVHDVIPLLAAVDAVIREANVVTRDLQRFIDRLNIGFGIGQLKQQILLARGKIGRGGSSRGLGCRGKAHRHGQRPKADEMQNGSCIHEDSDHQKGGKSCE